MAGKLVLPYPRHRHHPSDPLRCLDATLMPGGDNDAKVAEQPGHIGLLHLGTFRVPTDPHQDAESSAACCAAMRGLMLAGAAHRADGTEEEFLDMMACVSVVYRRYAVICCALLNGAWKRRSCIYILFESV